MESIWHQKRHIEKVWRTMKKMRDLIKSITSNSDDYDKKYMKKLELHNMVVVVGSVFHEGSRYYS